MINHKKILICVWLGYGLTILALVGNSLGQGLSFFDSLLFMVGFTLPLLITSIIITLEVKKNYTNSSEKLEEVVEVGTFDKKPLNSDAILQIVVYSLIGIIILVGIVLIIVLC